MRWIKVGPLRLGMEMAPLTLRECLHALPLIIMFWIVLALIFNGQYALSAWVGALSGLYLNRVRGNRRC